MTVNCTSSATLVPEPALSLAKRLLYLGYFVMKSRYGRLGQHARIVATRPARYRGILLWADMVRWSLRQGASFHEYFDLRYFELSDAERAKFLSTGLLHEFHRQNNASEQAAIFRDKARFCERFARFTGREVCNLDTTPRDAALAWLAQRSVIIAKPRDGTIGRGVQKIVVAERGADGTWEHLRSSGSVFAEDVIEQHPALAKLHPQSLNTVRIITWRVNDDVRVLNAFLRVGRGAVIDNFTSGGIGAGLDLVTGRAKRGVTKEFYDEPIDEHPLTGERITGFQVPFWPESLALVREAARVVPEVRTVGWDVAITPRGPCLVEGNDKWDKTSAQITAGEGIRHLISR